MTKEKTLRVVDSGVSLAPDSTRVVTRFFVPGREDSGPGDSWATPVVERVLALDDGDVAATIADLDRRFGDRHRDLHDTFARHAAMVELRIPENGQLSTDRRLLLGASFTHEYSIEAAALCNPSAVVLPNQRPGGDIAFVLSVRGIGEGHRSSIGFRTGTLHANGAVTVDAPARFARTGTPVPGLHHRSVFHAKHAALHDDHENAAHVLDSLPEVFDDAELDIRVDELAADHAMRRHTSTTIAHIRDLARSSYRVEFPASTDVSERVLWPHAPAESHGMEDARFVRFVDDGMTPTYYATYTAYDGTSIAQQLLQTDDFVTFTSTPMAGAAAAGKGLALFPRPIHGRYAALSRSDRETNSIAFSSDLRCWPTSNTIQLPLHPWEVLQLGNCGSPIETARGWLVLTHGVGPMRTYSLAALLLDLDEPDHVLARSTTPLLTPTATQRDGYVPNVVYSCGAFAHDDTLVLPYGVADQSIAIATVSITELVDSLSST